MSDDFPGTDRAPAHQALVPSFFVGQPASPHAALASAPAGLGNTSSTSGEMDVVSWTYRLQRTAGSWLGHLSGQLVSGEWAFERPNLVPGSGVSPETSWALLESPRGTAQGSGESRPEQVRRRVAWGSLCVRAAACVRPAASLWSSQRAQTACPEAGGAGVGKGIMKVTRVYLKFRARF